MLFLGIPKQEKVSLHYSVLDLNTFEKVLHLGNINSKDNCCLTMIPAVVMVILLVVAGVILVISFILANGNKKIAAQNVVIPFSAYVNSGDGTVDLTDSEGNPQIQCPAGFNVNIIGAYSDVIDPYGECSTPTDVFMRSCGLATGTSTSTCSDDPTSPNPCPSGLKCVSGKCQVNSCSTNQGCVSVSGKSGATACATGVTIAADATPCMSCGTNGNCQILPLCNNIDDKGHNKTCVDPANSCARRDASAYLASVCDGQNSCLGVKFSIATGPGTGYTPPFGPLPCKINLTDPAYGTLPIIPGWSGGTPPGGDQSIDPGNSYSQGYWVHGIYTCVPQ